MYGLVFLSALWSVRGNARIGVGRVFGMVAISKNGDLQEQRVTSTLL